MSKAKSDESPMMLISELLYASPPVLAAERIRNALKSILPHSKLVSDEDASALLIAHENHKCQMKDGKEVPPLTTIMRSDKIEQHRFSTALRQTWDWPGAAGAVKGATYQIIVTEMMAFMFQPQIRVDLYLKVLGMVMQIAPPLAVHCHHAERILNPTAFITALNAGDVMKMAAILNVRLFRVEGSAGEQLMDTRGLAALGLPDLQIHFRNLDSSQVAGMLYNTALYVYERGDCIKDGETIAGLAPAQKWRCQHEEALVGPNRLVIDIDPGDPFAAGSRKRHA